MRKAHVRGDHPLMFKQWCTQICQTLQHLTGEQHKMLKDHVRRAACHNSRPMADRLDP